ncbi:MAG: hypothetical protein NT062_09385 [Proteobacteria bacterium]|nr:hypothetical protein [Pseudomonadota bacterium]
MMPAKFAHTAVPLLAVSAAVGLALGGCKSDKIEVKPASAGDYNHAALQAAVDRFVVAGRTPEAYGELSRAVSSLRAGMDRAVAEEAELKLVVLALGPINSTLARPPATHVEELGLTVWPTLLAPKIESDTIVLKRAVDAADLMPKPDEDPHAYLERLCGGRLESDCKHVVPEQQGAVVEALALHRATERVRDAVAACLTCGTDPGWHTAVIQWEQIDRAATTSIDELRRRGDPDNWPVAGSAAEPATELPEAVVSARGEFVVGGHMYGPNQQRIDILKELRGNADALALQVRPDTTIAQLRAVLADARKAGVVRCAIVAREPVYPWRKKLYWVAEGSGMRANLRPTDSVQLLIHAVDEVNGPGTVARVD